MTSMMNSIGGGHHLGGVGGHHLISKEHPSDIIDKMDLLASTNESGGGPECLSGGGHLHSRYGHQGDPGQLHSLPHMSHHMKDPAAYMVAAAAAQHHFSIDRLIATDMGAKCAAESSKFDLMQQYGVYGALSNNSAAVSEAYYNSPAFYHHLSSANSLH
jgi:hypothetical protein